MKELFTQNNNPPFYICITTIRKYQIALQTLLKSLPNEWKDKYILVYNGEQGDPDFTIFPDGHIEVYLPNNISDYAAWVGAQFLMDKKVVGEDCWFLFLHDTTKIVGGIETVRLVKNLITKYQQTEKDLVWLSERGQCNICLIRRKAIQVGYDKYKDIYKMTKPETIKYEWEFTHPLSPKSFQVEQAFVQQPSILVGTKDVYGQNIARNILFYPSIKIEKYYVHIDLNNPGSIHPFSP